MTAQAAHHEISGFTEEVATMLASGVLHADRLRQIQVRVSRLAKLGAHQDPICDMILAMVAFGLGNREEAEQWARASVQNPLLASKVVLLNAANVLANVGSNEAAVAMIEVAEKRYANDSKVAMFEYKTYEKAGLIFRAAKAFEKYADLVAPGHKMAAPQYRQHQNEIWMAHQTGYTEEDISARLLTAIEAVRNSGFEVLRQGKQPLNDGTFIHNFYVATDVSHCADLNFDIADALSEHYDRPGSELFSVVCRPLDHYSVHNEVIRA